MSRIRIKWVSAKEINVRHKYLPSEKTATKIYKMLLKNNKPIMHLYQDHHGKLLLNRGIDAYNSLMVIDSNKKVPTIIVDEEINELDSTFKLLLSCFTENVYYKMKYEYIMLLLEETNNDIERICKEIGCSENEITKYIIDRRVPDKYKELAIEHQRQLFINKICRDPIVKDYRLFLYEAVFKTENRLTLDKFNYFKKYIKSGYKININSPNAIFKLNKVVDIDQAFKVYWNNLIFNHASVNEGATFHQKINKKDSRIRIKL
ncbi:hypothetical protein [Virgibacillus oceani]|uniref:Uncharacterized protein n=1 Tax=Virgibacillus oceani TaxID=1479511 RepID=A0A917M5C1_9BACI|nr:hypothetical protein [Virgibacillus oceani]GGG79915.1 hypothetical protein GCM10011398_26560 [Virgibacillus oceani]